MDLPAWRVNRSGMLHWRNLSGLAGLVWAPRLVSSFRVPVRAHKILLLFQLVNDASLLSCPADPSDSHAVNGTILYESKLLVN